MSKKEYLKGKVRKTGDSMGGTAFWGIQESSIKSKKGIDAGPQTLSQFQETGIGQEELEKLEEDLIKQQKAEQLKALVVSQLQAEQEANTSDSKSVIYENLFIPSFSTVSIKDFKLEQRLNDHLKMTFSAVVPEEENDNAVYYTQVGSQVEVKYTLKGFSKQKKLFQGLVTDVRVRTVGSVSMLYVTAHSNTIMLDAAKNSYSYQDISRSYESVVNEVLKRTKGATAIYDSAASNAIQNFMIQYKETDWEFIKRIASQKNLPLIPSYTSAKPQFYYGCKFGEKVHEIQAVEYTAQKNIRTFQKDSKNYIDDIEEKEYITYTIKSHQLLKLGDAVTFKGVSFYIRKATYEMEHGIVVGTYQLGRKSHFKQRRTYNTELGGISIDGSVTDVKRDKIKVHLTIDPKESSAQYWFPYSTMSASPDGSGWYCMPKEGDQVRVYFPDVEEKNCYAISSISSYSPAAGSTDKMSDPNVRYLRTPDGMEIKLDPSGITIDAYDGKAVISLDKQGNITINASKSLDITAAKEIVINAEKNISLYATKDISLEGAGGTIVLNEDGDTVLTGQYVLEN